ncbi:MAG: transcriptional repressor [Planctomycetes bacterium]|nr:transcriptional repressor [Planctomycetota bacterium]
MTEFVATCRRRGLRVTQQRTAVFRELAASDEHPDAETIYRRVRKRVATISRDTVYRTLATLEAQGLVSRAESLGGSARYDANPARHHHFVCTSCGQVMDFYSQSLDRLKMPRAVKAFGRIESAQVQVRGLCTACMKRNGKRRQS